MINRVLREWIPGIFITLVAIAIWQWAVPLFKIPTYILPTPSIILKDLLGSVPLLAKHSWVTLQEIIWGFLIGDAIGILIAIIISQWTFAERSLYPLIIFFQNVPKIAIAPIFVLWFGYGQLPKIVVAVVISFFPVVVNTFYGLKAVDPNLLDLARSVSATKYQILTKIQLPNALPHMFQGFKIAITFSVIGAIVGEWVGSDTGLGFLILLSSSQLETARLFSAIVVISLIGVALFYLISGIERLLIPWQDTTDRMTQTM